MKRRLYLDTGPIGWLYNPKRATIGPAWIQAQSRAWTVVVAAPVMYEARRDAIRREARQALGALGVILSLTEYEDLDQQDWETGAALWALARANGKPTADDKELDCDVLIGALVVRHEGAAVVTTNTKHFHAFGLSEQQVFNWEPPVIRA